MAASESESTAWFCRQCTKRLFSNHVESCPLDRGERVLEIDCDGPREAPAEREIRTVCGDLADMLVDKNRKYGDAALNPVRIASKSSPIEQILVRIDDKLSRWKNRQSDEDEDIENDLLGYLVLLKIARDRQRAAAAEPPK